MEKWLDDPTSIIHVITGLPGMGKTTLAAEFATRNKEDRLVLWHRCRGWDSMDVLIRRFAHLSSLQGHTKLNIPRISILNFGIEGYSSHFGPAPISSLQYEASIRRTSSIFENKNIGKSSVKGIQRKTDRPILAVSIKIEGCTERIGEFRGQIWIVYDDQPLTSNLRYM